MSERADGVGDGRRELHFGSVDDCLEELVRIREADKDGSLLATGDWSPGQILSHVANWINYAYDGFPVRRAPFFVRWILRFQLPKMLRGQMPAGVRIPGVQEGTVGMDEMATPEAVEMLVKALNRLESDEPALHESPAFGRMSHADRILLNLRHAELHLGFLRY